MNPGLEIVALRAETGHGGSRPVRSMARVALGTFCRGQGTLPGAFSLGWFASSLRASLGLLSFRPAEAEYKGTAVTPPFPVSAEHYASWGRENRRSSCFLQQGDCCSRQLLWQVFTQLCKAKPLPHCLADFPRSAPKRCQCVSWPVRLKFVCLQI